jgi:hypothetical protein
MRRYFFDVVGKKSPAYDYHGRELPAPESAYRLAELIALDLAMKLEDEWLGCAVNVRSVDGGELFSVPVQSCDLAAA